jgi:anthranilate 1,2-dioxygenase large subunit
MNDNTRIPYTLFQDPEVFEREQQRIYRGPTWSYLGLDAEIPNAGDFKTSFIGVDPVVVTRDAEGEIHCWVNRCAHQGATIVRAPRGNSADQSFTCVYHQWCYDTRGALIGVPFRRGVKGVGGYSAGFEPDEHSLRRFVVATRGGMIFATAHDQTPPLSEFLGEQMCANIDRVLNRPVRVLGYARQYMRGNWKLYSQNSRDGYHGALLHLFYPTFGIYRQSQDSSSVLSPQGFHNTFTIKRAEGQISYDEFGDQATRQMGESSRLNDPRVIDFKPERDDRIELSIQSLFPSVVLQQIQNTLATRQVLPKQLDRTELIWTYFGYEDDDQEMTAHRLRNINLVGPGGYVSMEDAEAVELCQEATRHAYDETELLALGGSDDVGPVSPMGLDEVALRGFWRGYRGLME